MTATLKNESTRKPKADGPTLKLDIGIMAHIDTGKWWRLPTRWRQS